MNAPRKSSSLVVAITGGIASGKSTVQAAFERLGPPVFDADVISRNLVARGEPALAQIAAAFGADALTAQGELDRRRMRERVFADDATRRELEAILHPRVRDELLARVRACVAPYCLLAIPLLAESGGAYAWVDRVIVVDVPRTTQLARQMQRDAATAETAQRLLDAQASRSDRLALADDVVDNSGDVEALVPVVQRLHERYLQAARRIASEVG